MIILGAARPGTEAVEITALAAAMCLAAGIWLEGVNFAMASGMYAGETAVEAVAAGDTSADGLGGYRRRLSETFVLRDHRRLRRAPSLVLSDRVQHLYPQMLANTGADGVFLDWWIDNQPYLSEPEVRIARTRIAKAIRSKVGPGPIIMGNVGFSRIADKSARSSIAVLQYFLRAKERAAFLIMFKTSPSQAS